MVFEQSAANAFHERLTGVPVTASRYRTFRRSVLVEAGFAKNR